MRRTAITFLVALGLTVALGLVGAWAFNPETGGVLRSESLWRILGVMAEGGLFLTGLLVVLWLLGVAVALIWSLSRRLLHRAARAV
jgi:hypothetical protein